MKNIGIYYQSALVDLLSQGGILDESTKPTAPGSVGKYIVLLQWLMWGAVIACVGGFIVAAAMLAYQRMQGGGGDAQGKLVGAMIGTALVASSIAIINEIMAI